MISKTNMSEHLPNFTVPNEHSNAAIRGIRRVLHFRRQPSAGIEAPFVGQASEMTELSEAPQSGAYDLVSGLISEDALRTGELAVQEEINSSPTLAELAKLDNAMLRNSEDANQAHRHGDTSREHELDEEYERLRQKRDGYSDEDRRAYSGLADRLYQIQRHGNIITGSETEVAQKLRALLQSAEPVQPSNSNEAPFAHHEKNSATEWQVVGDDSVRAYLGNRLFLDKEIDRAGTQDGSVIIKAAQNEPLEVPLNLVVRAAGFDSWTGRNPRYSKQWSSKYGAVKTQSLNVIKHYAGMESDVPPVDTIRVLIQPNGKILCDNGEGDSHRIAAAILQGKDTIRAENLKFMLLQSNILE